MNRTFECPRCDYPILAPAFRHYYYGRKELAPRTWREFHGAAQEAVRLCDERFAKMWEFYLAAAEMLFRKQNMMVSRFS